MHCARFYVALHLLSGLRYRYRSRATLEVMSWSSIMAREIGSIGFDVGYQRSVLGSYVLLPLLVPRSPLHVDRHHHVHLVYTVHCTGMVQIS